MKKIVTVLLAATIATSTMPTIMASAATNKVEEKPVIKTEISTLSVTPVNFSNYPVIKYGSDNWYVSRLKWALQYLGFGSYPYNDGTTYFGTNTRDAVYTYQQRRGLTVDGCVGPATWASLQADINMQPY